MPLPFCLACGLALGAIEAEVVGYEGDDYVLRVDHTDDRRGLLSCNTGGSRSVWTSAEVEALTWVV
ncbi:hypothetical protein GCM10009734_66770 [Nonomuraea bangladeshensis]